MHHRAYARPSNLTRANTRISGCRRRCRGAVENSPLPRESDARPSSNAECVSTCGDIPCPLDVPVDQATQAATERARDWFGMPSFGPKQCMVRLRLEFLFCRRTIPAIACSMWWLVVGVIDNSPKAEQYNFRGYHGDNKCGIPFCMWAVPIRPQAAEATTAVLKLKLRATAAVEYFDTPSDHS